MTLRPDERTYHTRLGWWVMTHDRGGPVVIGLVAVVVLIVDLVYAALHWTGSFPRAFFISPGALAAVALLLLRFVPSSRWERVGAHVAGTSGASTSCSWLFS